MKIEMFSKLSSYRYCQVLRERIYRHFRKMRFYCLKEFFSIYIIIKLNLRHSANNAATDDFDEDVDAFGEFPPSLKSSLSLPVIKLQTY